MIQEMHNAKKAFYTFFINLIFIDSSLKLEIYMI